MNIFHVRPDGHTVQAGQLSCQQTFIALGNAVTSVFLALLRKVILLIPLIFTPIITFTLSYLMTSIGVIPVMNGMEIPLGTPILLAGMLCGGWKLAVWQAVLVLVQIVCYFPFFKVLDTQALKEEQEQRGEI